MPNQIVLRPPFRKRGSVPFWYSALLAFPVTGSGGVEIGGSATVAFSGITGQVASDIAVEWDFDNDGDFSESVETITGYVLSLETSTGRDWPSLLTGKAGPGKFKATLDNSDNRFSYFNTSSPLATSPFSLKTGRKLRVRTSTATNPDPVLLAKDRFGRSDGAMGTPETGAAWTTPLLNGFTIVSKNALPATEGQTHIELIDVADTDYYVQARLSEVGVETNVVGLVYRYQDTANYSLAVVDVAAAAIKLIDVVAGVSATIQSESVEVYDEVTIGALVSSTSVTFYHEGVAVMTGTAIQTDETDVGIYASWGTGDTQPQIDDFYVWDGLPTTVAGILWTGDVSDVTTSVEAGPRKVAVLEGQGWLSRLGTQRLTPVRTVEGKKTGILVGNVLGRTNLLHPPGSIDEGDITTGPVGLGEMDAIEAVRRFEDTEFGFLFESQEGPLSYDSRTARASSVPLATFSDSSAHQFHYEEIEPLDWRKEVINRVFAGVAPSAPSGITLTEYSGNAITTIAMTMPATITAGDLLILNVAAGPFSGSATWTIPPGWVQYTGNASDEITYAGNNTLDQVNRILVKVATGDEDGDSLTFATGFDGATDSFSAQLYHITSWFGSLENGIVFGDQFSPNTTGIVGDDPPVVFPSWGPAPSLIIAWSVGHEITATFSSTDYPVGYTNGTNTFPGGGPAHPNYVMSARRFVASEVENPGSFSTVWAVDSGYYQQSIAIAVRGSNGNLNSGVVTVQLDDLDSQDDHNSLRTNSDTPELFASSANATTYAQLVLDTYADDRPILSISFHAIKNAAYRNQALRRRVGDKITLIANNNSGLGVEQDFFIESISHKFDDGTTSWEVTWELSPA